MAATPSPIRVHAASKSGSPHPPDANQRVARQGRGKTFHSQITTRWNGSHPANRAAMADGGATPNQTPRKPTEAAAEAPHHGATAMVQAATHAEYARATATGPRTGAPAPGAAVLVKRT